MRKLLFAIVLLPGFTLGSAVIIANAAETCTQRLEKCSAGRTSRNQKVFPCTNAWPSCMKTGIWETKGGQFGRRVENVIRK